MFNPMTYLNPAQRQQMQQLKELGKRIKATIIKRENRVEVVLSAGDEEAASALPGFAEAVCQSVGQALHVFDVTGEIVDRT